VLKNSFAITAYLVVANSCAACPKLECERPECGTLFCYHCKGEWHANQTCDEARGKSMERMFASAASALNRSGSLTEIIGAASLSTNEPFKRESFVSLLNYNILTFI
jgi:hypothetical protein